MFTSSTWTERATQLAEAVVGRFILYNLNIIGMGDGVLAESIQLVDRPMDWEQVGKAVLYMIYHIIISFTIAAILGLTKVCLRYSQIHVSSNGCSANPDITQVD